MALLRYKFSLRFFPFLLVALLLCASEAKCDDNDAYLKKMVDSWRQRQTAIKTLRAEWTETSVSSAKGNGQLPEQQIVIFTLGPSGETRLEVGPDTESRKKGTTNTAVSSRKGTAISAFNGLRNHNFTSAEGPDDWPRGIVWSEKKALPHNLLLERRVEGGVFKALPSRNGRGSKRIYAISASKNSRFVPSGF